MADNSSSSSSTQAESTSSGHIESPIALLDLVEDAIIAVLNMQEYRLGDRTVTYANLGELRKLRTELKTEVAQLQGNRPAVSSIDLGGNF